MLTSSTRKSFPKKTQAQEAHQGAEGWKMQKREKRRKSFMRSGKMLEGGSDQDLRPQQGVKRETPKSGWV
jgi:hypothetical protein